MAKEIKNPNAEAVVEAVSKTEQFFNENGKLLSIIAAAVVVVAAGIFCWHKFAYQPKVQEAQGQMAYAEQNFRAGDFETALNGDGNVLAETETDAEPILKKRLLYFSFVESTGSACKVKG